MISNNAKFFCMLGGIAIAAVVITFGGHSNFKEVEAYERDFQPELDVKSRDQARAFVVAELSGLGDPCDAAIRKSAQRAVENYYYKRAWSLAVAERYLAPVHTEEVRLKWDGIDGKKVEDLVLAAAGRGYYARDDFRPTTYPDLAALLEKVPPTVPACPNS